MLSMKSEMPGRGLSRPVVKSREEANANVRRNNPPPLTFADMVPRSEVKRRIRVPVIPEKRAKNYGRSAIEVSREAAMQYCGGRKLTRGEVNAYEAWEDAWYGPSGLPKKAEKPHPRNPPQWWLEWGQGPPYMPE